MDFSSLIKIYYHLAKPGIIYGNAINALAGFFLASTSAGTIDWWLLVAVMVGTSLVIASGCVCNNYLDQNIDKKMTRTKSRALIQGLVSGRSALVYASVLGLSGFVVLGLFTNTLTFILGLTALFMYVVVYGIAKRRSVHGTVVGSIPGALPPVAAYTAVTGQLDTGAVILFLIMAIWQLPHFYAIAMYRLGDYKAAGLPVLPVVHGMRTTKIYILAYIALFTTVAPLLTVFGYTGFIYAGTVLLLGCAWFIKGLRGLKVVDDARWARSMFFFSLIVTLGLSLALSLGPLLP